MRLLLGLLPLLALAAGAGAALRGKEVQYEVFLQVECVQQCVRVLG